MTSLENRNSSALFKRAEQLKRWGESDTSREPAEPKRKSQRIQFTDGCVFLAACAASDREEVERLLKRGADIDTANIDGLTALHQACIDDNLDMVEFLVERGADVNRGDNEGWTPLHATASCGFLSIAKYLLEKLAKVNAVNNDGELAIDISESDEMEALLQEEVDAQNINCEESRNTEERLMLDDAHSWMNSKVFGDAPHTKTGATALHVAAAKGYIKVMGLLIQGGAAVNSQDLDGWTPLHAAAHWAQREACEILCENYANMDIKNYVGQTAFDVVDPDVLRLLEELKKKQATLQKDRPDIRYLFNRPPVPPGQVSGKRRSSITRLSVDDKAQRSKEVSTQERDLLLHKTIESNQDRTKTESLESPDVEYKPLFVTKDDLTGTKAPGYSPPHLEERTPRKTLTVVNAEGELEEIHPWRRPASLRVRPTFNSDSLGVVTSTGGGSASKLSPAKEEQEDVQLRRVHSFESDEKFYAKLTELRARIRNTSGTTTLATGSRTSTSKPSNTSLSLTHSSNNESHHILSSVAEDQPAVVVVGPPGSLSPRSNEDTSLSSTMSSATSSSSDSWTSRKKREDISSIGNRPKSDPPKQQPSQVRRSFVPPVRDEESETQRKAHAKRVRETRRSTQGVTLEDLKSAEQLVKKKQQQENQQRTSELQQLVASQQQQTTVKPSQTTTTATTILPSVSIQQPSSGSSSASSSITAVSTSASIAAAAAAVTSGSTSGVTSGSNTAASLVDSDRHERRPSWRLRLDASDKTKFRLEEEPSSSSRSGGKNQNNALTALARKGSKYESGGRSPDLISPTIPENKEVPSVTITSSATTSPGSPTASASSSLQPSNHRRKKPKRRSTGVVNLEFDDFDQDGDSGEDDYNTTVPGGNNTDNNIVVAPVDNSSTASNNNNNPNSLTNRGLSSDRSQNGEIDYRKLWEQSQLDNSKLRDDLARTRDELKTASKKLDTVVHSPPSSSGLTDTEKQEKKALEKKLSEMEEELKLLALSENLTDQQLEHLKNDNQRLRDENGALIRVISKLSK